MTRRTNDQLARDLDDLAAVLSEIDEDIRAEREAPRRLAAAPRRDFSIPSGAELAAPYSSIPAVATAADQPFAAYMGEFRRLARGGVSLEAIGAAFGFPPSVMAEIIQIWPDVARAHAQCAALAIGNAADQLQNLIGTGELGAITFFLKTKGGFATAAERESPLVNINIGSMPAPVSAAHADELLREHEAFDAPLVDGVLVHEKPDPAGTGSGA